MWRENCANKVQLERDVECSENCLLVHIAALDPVIYSTQAGTTWSLSSQADLIPKKSSKWKCWHSHQKYLIWAFEGKKLIWAFLQQKWSVFRFYWSSDVLRTAWLTSWSSQILLLKKSSQIEKILLRCLAQLVPARFNSFLPPPENLHFHVDCLTFSTFGENLFCQSWDCIQLGPGVDGWGTMTHWWVVNWMD